MLEEDALLFSGDHILNGSTTVISPPDGNMIDYLASLDKLHALCLERSIRYILPAHGYVLGFARHQITKLKAHRLARESKVHNAMRTKPDGSISRMGGHCLCRHAARSVARGSAVPAGPCGADSEALSGQISQQPPPRPVDN